MNTGPTLDARQLFAAPPPRADRPGRLAASRRRAAFAASVAAVLAAGLVVVVALL